METSVRLLFVVAVLSLAGGIARADSLTIDLPLVAGIPTLTGNAGDVITVNALDLRKQRRAYLAIRHIRKRNVVRVARIQPARSLRPGQRSDSQQEQHRHRELFAHSPRLRYRCRDAFGQINPAFVTNRAVTFAAAAVFRTIERL